MNIDIVVVVNSIAVIACLLAIAIGIYLWRV